MDNEEKAAKPKAREQEALRPFSDLARELGQSPVAVAAAKALRGWDGESLVTPSEFLAACADALGVAVA